ncbi:MAG: hypothetical protein HW419_4447 [Deltaproteobacteria bacterium]|nr:hypothetical protein [Deltaproteobacteria bacterium]
MSSNPAATQQVAQRDSNPAVATYGRILRVIGQDLAGFFPRTLEITTDGVIFEVQGQCHPNPFEAIRETFLNRIWRRVARKASAAAAEELQPPACFARTYDADEIERLDSLYGANREENSRRADAYSLSERLRTMGAIVDKKNGSLKRLHKQADRLFIEYWDPQGQLQSAKLTTVIFYRNQQDVDPRRQNPPPELWEGYDF